MFNRQIRSSELLPRRSAILAGAAVLVALGACGAGSGTTESGGRPAGGSGGSGGGGNTTTSSGGTTVSSGGSGGSASGGQASGGTSATGGQASGGTSATGGQASGGTSATGGKSSGPGGGGAGGVATGGASSAAGSSGQGGTGATTGPVDGGTEAPVGNELWIAPTGDDTKPGTKESPMLTVPAAIAKMCGSGATASCAGKEGFTIWVMGGTYLPKDLVIIPGNLHGLDGKRNKVWAAPGEKPVFDCSATPCLEPQEGQPCFASWCVQVRGNYWHVKGFEVTKARDTGVIVHGSHNIIELVNAHHNGDTGMQIQFSETINSAGGTNNLFLNCDASFNYDAPKGGENADGFGAKKNKGEGNVFRGCRAWDNSDDGWDFYGWTSPVKLEGCYAMNSSRGISGPGSDGNGYKLGGGTGASGNHVFSKCFAINNPNVGFKANGGQPSSCPANDCGAWDNGSATERVSGVTIKSGPSSAKVIAAQRDAEGNLPEISKM